MTDKTVDTYLPLFRQEFQELAEKPDADVGKALKLALQIHAVRQDATLYLAAHLLAMAQLQEVNKAGNIPIDGGGFIKVSESMAGQTIAFQNPDATERSALLGTTSYGRTFLLLEKGSVAAIGARVYG